MGSKKSLKTSDTQEEWSIKKKLVLYKLVKEYGQKWTVVADILESTPAVVRGKYRHTDWLAFFRSNNITEKEVINDNDLDKMITEKIEPMTAEEHVKELVEQEKYKIISSHEKNKAKALLKELAAQDLIYEKLLGAIASVPPIDVEEIKPPDKDSLCTRPEEAVLILSDLHLGCVVKSEEVGGFGEYNKDIFIKRLNSLVDKVIKITNRHRKSAKIETLNLFFLGDNVHGSNNAGQWGFLNTEPNIVDQLFILWDEVERAVLKLKTSFPKINIHCVYGNHGRIAKRGFEKNFVNWDFLLYHMLQKTLKNQKGIKWSIPRAPFDIANVLGHKFLLIHGDQVRGWGGLPFYGMTRAESKYRALFDRNTDMESIQNEALQEGIDKADFETQMKFISERVRSFDYMCMGHFHHMAELETPSGGRIIMNSSFAGGDDYSINDLLTANTAAQKFFGVHPEGKSWSYDIALDRE